MKSRCLPVAAAAGLAAILSACTTVSLIRLKDYESRPPSGHIDVYASAAAVTRPYKEMALISCDRSESSLHEEVLAKAREIGADGIILEAPYTSTTWATSRTVTRAIAIVYK